MPQPRRSLRSGLASLLAAFGSLACGGERTTQRVVGDECDNGITLRVADWGDPALEAAYLAAAQRFVLAQPCVAVEVEIVPVSNHAEYLDWHLHDHLPEQHRLPGLRHGQRWVSTPACRAARAAS